jgi:hypothetical protein
VQQKMSYSASRFRCNSAKGNAQRLFGTVKT